MKKVKQAAKKHGVAIAILGFLSTATPYILSAVEKEKALRERNEIFFSNEQDRINCIFDSLRVRTNCNINP